MAERDDEMTDWMPAPYKAPDPAPLTPLEVATIKACIGKYTPSHIARLVATVEQTRRERDAAYACIRRYDDGWENFCHNGLRWNFAGDLVPMTPAEVDAIRRAQAGTESTTDRG